MAHFRHELPRLEAQVNNAAGAVARRRGLEGSRLRANAVFHILVVRATQLGAGSDERSLLRTLREDIVETLLREGPLPPEEIVEGIEAFLSLDKGDLPKPINPRRIKTFAGDIFDGLGFFAKSFIGFVASVIFMALLSYAISSIQYIGFLGIAFVWGFMLIAAYLWSMIKLERRALKLRLARKALSSRMSVEARLARWRGDTFRTVKRGLGFLGLVALGIGIGWLAWRLAANLWGARSGAAIAWALIAGSVNFFAGLDLLVRSNDCEQRRLLGRLVQDWREDDHRAPGA